MLHDFGNNLSNMVNNFASRFPGKYYTCRFKDAVKPLVCDTFSQWNIDGVAFTFTQTNILRRPVSAWQTCTMEVLRKHLESPSPWEEITKEMERTSHNSVCGVERFFNSIAVMHIDIDVEHPRVNSGKC